MSMIIVLDNEYNNKLVNYKVLKYVMTSSNTFICEGRGLPVSNDMGKADIAESAIFMSMPQKMYGIAEGDKRLIHMVLAYQDLNTPYLYEEILIKSSLSYFYEQGFQCVASSHYKSDNRYYEHIHIIINKISLNFKKFNESNGTYYDFANYLHGITGANWDVWRKPSHWDESLFEEDIW